LPRGWAYYGACFREAIKQRGLVALALLMALSVITVGAVILFVFTDMGSWKFLKSFPLLELVIVFITFFGGLLLGLFLFLYLGTAMLASATSRLKGEGGSARKGMGAAAAKAGLIFRSIRHLGAYSGGSDIFSASILLYEDFMGFRSARERSKMLSSSLGKEVESAELFGSRMYWLCLCLPIPIIIITVTTGRSVGLSDLGIIALLALFIAASLWLMGMNLAAIQTLKAKSYLEVTSTA